MSPGHYFDPDPTSDPGSPDTPLTLTLPDLTVRLRTERGVFSPGRIDPGTRVLLTCDERPSGGVLVDLGCGYGPIAVALASRAPGATVWAVEVNARARDLAARNAAALGLVNVQVTAPADVPADLVVDEVWSNPPIRVGKDALHALLTEWLGRLRPSGRMLLVVQRHLGADSLAAWLDQQGAATRRVVSRQGYRVLEVRPGGASGDAGSR